jgi:hypothetical protein
VNKPQHSRQQHCLEVLAQRDAYDGEYLQHQETVVSTQYTVCSEYSTVCSEYSTVCSEYCTDPIAASG